MTEKEKMLAGKLYDPTDPELSALRAEAHRLSQLYNLTLEQEADKRQELLDRLLPNRAESAWLQGPVYFDYGCFTTLGRNFYANFNFSVLDEADVTIGDHVFIGPNVGIYTAIHPLDPKTRSTGLERAEPVRIGDDVWIGGGAQILPGVTIGSRSVIGAGSVVTRDIPDDVVAAGNPCRVIRSLKGEQDEEDRQV